MSKFHVYAGIVKTLAFTISLFVEQRLIVEIKDNRQKVAF